MIPGPRVRFQTSEMSIPAGDTVSNEEGPQRSKTQLRPEDAPEVMGLGEIVEFSDLSTGSGVLYLAESDPRFPRPIAELKSGSLWLGLEVRRYFKQRTKQRRLKPAEVEAIRKRAVSSTDDAVLAEAYQVSAWTIRQIRLGHR